MTTINTDAPRLYVGTYAKYNSGSIAGAWLDLSDYSDRNDFLQACAKLHKDEPDPELMFQDFENFPRSFYQESSVPAELWAWIELSDDDKELLTVYRDHVESDADIDQARDAFQGKADSESAWAEQYLDDAGMLSELPKWAASYFDFEAYARDAQLGGDVTFVRHGGDVWVFSNR